LGRRRRLSARAPLPANGAPQHAPLLSTRRRSRDASRSQHASSLSVPIFRIAQNDRAAGEILPLVLPVIAAAGLRFVVARRHRGGPAASRRSAYGRT
jgi:hypothetical protein